MSERSRTRKNRLVVGTSNHNDAIQQQQQQNARSYSLLKRKQSKGSNGVITSTKIVVLLFEAVVTLTFAVSLLQYHSNKLETRTTAIAPNENKYDTDNTAKRITLTTKPNIVALPKGEDYHASNAEAIALATTKAPATKTSEMLRHDANTTSYMERKYRKSLPIFEPPADLVVHGALKKYKAVPSAYEKTFCLGSSRVLTAKNAFLKHGWTELPKGGCEHHAHVVYYGEDEGLLYNHFLSWQRFSLVANSDAWEHKNDFLTGLRSYAKKRQHQKTKNSMNTLTTINNILYFIPETYLLYDESDRKEFQSRLYEQNGMDQNWVLKNPKLNNGKGVEILGAHSLALQNVLSSTQPNATKAQDKTAISETNNPKDPQHQSQASNHNQTNTITITNTTDDDDDDDEEEGDIEFLIQQYICNELVWFKGQKFDLRFYWFVASVDPPIVLFHDGFVRVSKSIYQENDFSDKGLHLTNHKYRDDGNVGDVLADNLWDLVTQHYEANKKELESKLPPTVQGDPVMHVRNQMKEAIGTFSAAFMKSSSSGALNNRNKLRQFQNPHADIVQEKVSAQNLFGFYGCDFIIDNDLDVYFIEAQVAPGFDKSKKWRQDLSDKMFYPIPLLIEEIQTKQTNDSQANLLPIQNLHSWEVVRAGDWNFQYHGYQRQMESKKKCRSDVQNQQ